MNAAQFESFQLGFNRQAIGAGLIVTVSGRVAPSVPDLFAFWKDRRAEILADPAVAGLTHDPNGEDVSIAINKRTIAVSIKFLDPKK